MMRHPVRAVALFALSLLFTAGFSSPVGANK